MMTDILCPTCGRPNPDNQSECEFCGSPLGAEELSRLDDLVSPDEPADEISRLDDFAVPEKSREDKFDETSIRDEIFSIEEPSDQPSLRDEIFSAEEEPDESSLLDEIFSSEQEPDLTQDNSFQPTEPLSVEEPPDDAEIEIPPLEESLLQEIIEETIVPELTIEPKVIQEGPADSTSPPSEWLPDEDTTTDDIQQSTEALDDLEPDQMSPGFGEDSGWLDMLQEPDLTEEGEPVPAEASSGVKKKDTDWLEKIKRLNKSADLVDDDSSFPDWLTATEKAAAAKVEQTEQPATSTGDVPDWLQMDQDDEHLSEFLRKKDLTLEESVPEKAPEPIQEEVEKDVPEAVSPVPPDGEKTPPKKFPSWAADADGTPLDDEDIPDELKFLAGIDPTASIRKMVDPFQVEEDYFDDLFSDELPNWLENASDEGVIITSEDELTVGELPGWVEAMRPVVESTDTTGLSDDEEYIENYGPLAGIPSVLPAEAEGALDPEKASKKPLTLTATKTHQDYVSILRKLIAYESKTKEIKKPAPIQTQRILRWLIAIILLVTTAGTIIFGSTYQTQVPVEGQIHNTGFWAVYNQIDKLYAGQPVLIAFDYQPAATGELHTAASSIVDHLMMKGAFLSFVSTQPTGPALAEHFLATTQKEHDYRHNQQYINLGYLPGESAGLVSFLIAPKQIIPLAFDGSNAWGSPPLVNVNTIGDFEMILVITDDPNTAKIWIEQIGPNLEDTPLIMVVSAQAEPLIQPYFRSSPQLLTGYVSGVIDSMKYESLLEKPNLATAVWLPFNIGILVTVSTIFIGGLANGFLSLFSRHRSRKTGVKK